MKSLIASLTLLIAVPALLNAQATWKPDKAHSQVKFSVTHMVISEVTGSFTDFDASLQQPSNDSFDGSTVQAVIKTASISTNNDRRDQHLRTDDFFNAGKYPEIRFASTAFTKTGPDTYRISGNLTIRDTTRPVVLDAKMTGMLNAWGGTHVGFKATTSIDRFDYGVKWDKTLDAGGLIVSRNVDITLLFEFVKQQQEAEKPK